MRPLGKCMKAAHNEKVDKKRALNDMLSSYRATPHPSTGIAPGSMMFRSGYKKDFPRSSIDEETITKALHSDRDKKEKRWQEINKSNHRIQTKIKEGQLVFTRNNIRNKFDPIFGPELYKVVDIKGNGTTLLRLSDSTIFRRHLDDIKDASAISPAEPGETCCIDRNVSRSPQRESQPRNPLVAAGPPPEAAIRPNAANRPQRERQPPAYYRDDQWEMRR